MTSEIEATKLLLPTSIIRKRDVSSLVSEAERIDNAMTTNEVHQKIKTGISPEIIMSNQMIDFLQINKIEFGDSKQRDNLISSLRIVKDKLPIVHATFASNVEGEVLEQLVSWLRDSVHPFTVISVGVQPSLIGGVYLRTSNRVYDFSIKAQLAGCRDTIVKDLEAMSRGK